MPKTDTSLMRAVNCRLRVLALRWLAVLTLCMAAGLLVVVPSSSFALPAGRHYEMVSPVYKAGFGATAINAVASNGDGVVFYSPGNFAGAPAGVTVGSFMNYFARRTSSGWETASLAPPAWLLGHWEDADFSPSLETMLAIGEPGPNGETPLPVGDVLLHSTDLPDSAPREGEAGVSGWEQVGELNPVATESFAVQEVAADPDFCHVLLKTNESLLSEATIGKEAFGQRYEFDRGCKGESVSLKLVGVNNQETLMEPACPVDIGVEREYDLNGKNTFNAVSDNGDEVFFTDCAGGPKDPHQLFVSLGGARTVEVSKPFVAPEACAEVPCAGASQRASAEFAGASEDGSRVFFTAPLAAGQQPLVAGDTDVSNNLYMATMGCSESNRECSVAGREVVSLNEVSHDLSGGAAGVAGVLRVAPDGQRAYFVANGDLLSPVEQQTLESKGRPVPLAGAENLYVYDGTSSPGTVTFIGDLCSGKDLSGSVEDIHCPSGENDASLWLGDGSESQTAGSEGRFLVFSTYAQLTGDDVNTARDVYRYDADTGVLVRVSAGENGYKANGNNGAFGSSIHRGNHGQGTEEGEVHTQYEMSSRAISEDGSRIVFTSAEPLSPMASNGLANVYEWRENTGGSGGSVSLITSGSGEAPVEDVVISPDGLNVFFDTDEGLVSQDTDGASDVYDARIGEGFTASPMERHPCEGDACQGPLTNPAPLLVPGSFSQAPGQNAIVPVSKRLTKQKPKAKTKIKRCKQGYKRDKRGKCVKVGKASRMTVAHRHNSGSVSSGRGIL
jgi:hypothetical protein